MFAVLLEFGLNRLNNPIIIKPINSQRTMFFKFIFLNIINIYVITYSILTRTIVNRIFNINQQLIHITSPLGMGEYQLKHIF